MDTEPHINRTISFNNVVEYKEFDNDKDTKQLGGSYHSPLNDVNPAPYIPLRKRLKSPPECILLVSVPATLTMVVAVLLTLGLGSGAIVKYTQKDATTGKKLAISSGSCALVSLIAYIIYKIAK